MKGIILAGGHGTRLYPITQSVSKQLLPIYDKPMIYYPLSILMLANIQDILIISTPTDLPRMQKALGDGSNFGIKLSYKEQSHPNGIAESFLIAEEFIGKSNVCLILGDNIFYGEGLAQKVQNAAKLDKGGLIFAYKVSDPARYGVIKKDEAGNLLQIVEKPQEYISDYAVTGIYFYDNTIVNKAKSLTPSARGELEITDIQNLYIKENNMKVEYLSSGYAWLDAGTYDSLLEASHFVQVIEKRQGIKIACLEKIAYKYGWISKAQLEKTLLHSGNNSYTNYLKKMLDGNA